jgi:predicted RNA methylase
MNQEFIWSKTDFPFQCLLDKVRTTTFQRAIEASVRAGDVVVDVGSGSGILALFAARAGARRVYAVEMDNTLAVALRKTAAANGFKDVIEVIEGDAMTVELPRSVNVVIAELIDTGLIDEMQLPVMNRLIQAGVISASTRVIPGGYTTFVEPIFSDQCHYGFKILAPHHDWPFFHDSSKQTWAELSFESLAQRQQLVSLDLTQSNSPLVSARLEFRIASSKPVTGIRLSGTVWLDQHLSVGATNTMNSDKVLMLEPFDHRGHLGLQICYEMGRGMQGLRYDCATLA